MMTFRSVKESIIDNVLGPSEAGLFRTIGYRSQTKSADEVKDSNRTVQVYYSSGQFGKARRPTGPIQHAATFRLEFAVSKEAEADLSVLTDDNAETSSRAAALEAMREASMLADESIDELFDIVFQIIMDGRNEGLGLSKGTVIDRWIDNFQKDDPVPNGEVVILTGSANLTCAMAEDVPGSTGTESDKVFNTVLEGEDDETTKTGVQVGE